MNVKVILTKTEKLIFLVHYVQPSVDVGYLLHNPEKKILIFGVDCPPSTTNGEKFC